MAGVGEAVAAADDCGRGSESRATRDQEHDQDLVLDGFDGLGSREDLSGHHARQGDQPTRRHRIDDGGECGTQRRAADGPQRLVSRRAEREARLDRRALSGQARSQGVEPEGHAVIVLPSTMPRSGSAKRGWYQGSGLTCTHSAKTVTSVAATSMQLVPRP